MNARRSSAAELLDLDLVNHLLDALDPARNVVGPGALLFLFDRTGERDDALLDFDGERAALDQRVSCELDADLISDGVVRDRGCGLGWRTVWLAVNSQARRLNEHEQQQRDRDSSLHRGSPLYA